MSYKCVIFMAALVMVSLVAVSAAAQEQAAPADREEAVKDKALAGAGTRAYDPERAFFGPLPRYTNRDGNISVGAGLLLDFDAGHYGKSGTRGGTSIDKLEDGVRDRRVILRANALLYKDFILFGSWNFTDRDDRFSDGLRSAVVIYRGFDPWWIRVGQHNIASPLDAARGIRSFMEESMASGALGYAPGTPSLGASVSHRGAHHNIRLGVWSVPVKEMGGDREGYGVHGRVSYAPIVERTKALHFGVAGYWRKPTLLKGEASGGEQFKAPARNSASMRRASSWTRAVSGMLTASITRRLSSPASTGGGRFRASFSASASTATTGRVAPPIPTCRSTDTTCLAVIS